MKEQVSVDVYHLSTGNIFIPKEEYERLKKIEKLQSIKEENKQLASALYELGEFNRLKRLDENVKHMIKDLNVALGVDQIVKKYNEFDRKAYEHFLKLLESLYEE